MKDPNYPPKQLAAWKEFQKALSNAKKKLGALSGRTAGGVHELCWEGLAQADLWSR